MQNETESKNQEFIIALFEGKDSANEAVKRVSEQASGTVPDLHEKTAVISMNENGKISSSTAKGKAVKGAALGGLVGLLIGLPVGGAIVGGIIGFTRRKHKADTFTDEVTIEQIANQMKPDSSILISEVEDWQAATVADTLYMNGAVNVIHTHKDKLATLITEDNP